MILPPKGDKTNLDHSSTTMHNFMLIGYTTAKIYVPGKLIPKQYYRTAGNNIDSELTMTIIYLGLFLSHSW